MRQEAAKGRDCQQCVGRGSDRARGCYPRYRLAKPVKFTRADLKDSEVAYYCAASVSGAVAQAGWFSDYNRFKDGHLPRPGSWGEHPHRWCQGIDLIDSEIKRRESEQLQEMKDKNKRG